MVYNKYQGNQELYIHLLVQRIYRKLTVFYFFIHSQQSCGDMLFSSRLSVRPFIQNLKFFGIYSLEYY